MTILHAAEICVYISICLIAKIEFIAIVQFLFPIYSWIKHITQTLKWLFAVDISIRSPNVTTTWYWKPSKHQFSVAIVKSKVVFLSVSIAFAHISHANDFSNCNLEIPIFQSFCYSKRIWKVFPTKKFQIVRNFMEQSAFHIDNSIPAKLLYTVNVRNTTCVNVSTEFAK